MIQFQYHLHNQTRELRILIVQIEAWWKGLLWCWVVDSYMYPWNHPLQVVMWTLIYDIQNFVLQDFNLYLFPNYLFLYLYMSISATEVCWTKNKINLCWRWLGGRTYSPAEIIKTWTLVMYNRTTIVKHCILQTAVQQLRCELVIIFLNYQNGLAIS